MAKSRNKKELFVPNIIGLETDIAGDILDDLGIKYEIQEKKIITLFRDKNCVAKTIPKKNKVINSDETLKIYQSKFKIGPYLILIILLLSALIYFINKTSITPLFGGEPSISLKDSGWNESNIIYINDDAIFNYSEVDHYKYCVNKTKSTAECDWKDTYTKSIRISESGTWFVWFKGISVNNDESSISNRLKVLIDNESPSILAIDKVVANKSIEVKIDAKDSLSGIDKYYYSINNNEYIEDNKSHIFTSLDENTIYNIGIRVVDKVGNYIDASINLSTSSSNKNESSSTTLSRVIPQINMIDIPSYINVNDKYNVPTSITPNKLSDNLTCVDELGNTIDNTNTLSIGNHLIKCIYSYDNLSITTFKNINVLIDEGKDTVFEDKVRINLDYPTNATKYMYRFNNNDVRLKDNQWTYYVEPLYIDKDIINNIIIKYDLDGEKIIDNNDDLLIDIRPDKYILDENQETNINIYYENKNDKVYYSINNSSYKEYTDTFKVKGNTIVSAYIERSVKVYDEVTNKISYKSIINKDAVFIESNYSNVGSNNSSDLFISLDGIPSTIDYKEANPSYSIPTAYSYGSHGTYILSCTADGKKINNTSDLDKGEHDIICTITGMDGESKTTSKHITIVDNDFDYYIFDLDNIPSIIKQGTSYELDKTCNVDNTDKLKVGKHTIKCHNISKVVEIVNEDFTSIDLNNLPIIFEVGTLYELPSHFNGSNINYIKCLDENKNIIYNTSLLPIGNHSITCSIKSNNDIKTVVKDITITKPKYIIDISK